MEELPKGKENDSKRKMKKNQRNRQTWLDLKHNLTVIKTENSDSGGSENKVKEKYDPTTMCKKVIGYLFKWSILILELFGGNVVTWLSLDIINSSVHE